VRTRPGIHGKSEHAPLLGRVIETFGEAHDRCLAGRIARSMRETVAGAAANQVNNPAVTAGKHCWRSYATSVERTTQIDLDILPPGLGITFPDRTESPERPMVVDQQVDRAELGCDPIEHFFDRTAVNQVDREGDGTPAFLANQRHCLIYLACRPRQNGNLGAVSRLI